VATVLVDDLVETCLEYEEQQQQKNGEDYLCINRVMLAMCMLSPGVLERRKDDPLVEL